MSIWVLAGVFYTLLLSLSIAILWLRQMRPPKEDPRLSRGLQLLQNKISILEDLSERTDTQVKQLVQILEERAKILQTKILNAESTVARIEQSMHRSLEVAKIFQDKIPHAEIIERDTTQKYVQAAKLSHQGLSMDEILKQVDIPRSELEFIVKVNREELTFNPELLPEWAKSDVQRIDVGTTESTAIENVFISKTPDLSGLERASANFKMSVQDAKDEDQRIEQRQKQLEEKAEAFKQAMVHAAAPIKQAMAQAAGPIKQAVAQAASPVIKSAEPVIKKFQFPRI